MSNDSLNIALPCLLMLLIAACQVLVLRLGKFTMEECSDHQTATQAGPVELPTAGRWVIGISARCNMSDQRLAWHLPLHRRR